MRYHSVTEVLSPYNSYAGIDPYVLGIAAARGSLVHLACGSYARGLFVPRLDIDAALFFRSFEDWFDHNVKKVLTIEETFSDDILKYTGRPDLVVELKDGGIWLFDIKTPVIEGPTWRGQLAAYWMLARDYFSIDRIGSLQLSKQGKEPRVVEYSYKDDDFAAFHCALMAYRYFKGG